MGDARPPGPGPGGGRADSGYPGTLSEQLGFGGPGGGSVLRSMAAWFLVVVAVLAIPLSVLLFWVVRTVDNEAQYARTLAPLAVNPAVTAFVANQVTTGLLTAASEAGLPTEALAPTVRAAVEAAVASPAFPAIWTSAVTVSHQSIEAALRGKARPSGPVTINLTPVAQSVITSLHAQGNPTFDKLVAEDGQPQVVVKITSAKSLRQIRSAFQAVLVARWVLPVVALAAAVGAVVLAPRRRRILLALAVGTAAVAGITVAATSLVRSVIVSNIQEGGSNRAAAGAAYDALLRYLRIDLFIVVGAAALLLVGVAVWWIVAHRRPAPGSRAESTVRP